MKPKPKTLPLLTEIFNFEFDKLKEQFYGEEIAMKLHKHNCPDTALVIAEEKVKYLKQHSEEQSSIKF